MKIAILGTGLMGSALAKAMLKTGKEIIVYNRTTIKMNPLVDLGAICASSASEAIKMSDASIILLADGKAFNDMILNEEVLLSLKGKKLLNASTTSIDEIIKFNNVINKYGGNLAEISIMVGSEQLSSQQASFLLGCDDCEEKFWTEILKDVGSVLRVGNISDATKVETPIVFASVFSSVMMAYAGVALLKLNIINENGIDMVKNMIPGSEYLLPNLLKRNYNECIASTDSLIGVVDVAINTSRKLGIPSKIFENIKELYVKTSEMGYGKKDASSLVETLLNFR